MGKTLLCQIVAVCKGQKSQAEQEFTNYHRQLAADPAAFAGMVKSFEPLNDEDKDSYPAESHKVQIVATEVLDKARDTLENLMNVIAIQESTNCVAKANIEVNGEVIAKDVPAGYLLFLEKKLVDIHTFVSKIQTLPTDKEWTMDGQIGLYKSPVVQTNRLKKTFKNHVKAPATDKHPAQVDVYTEDVPVARVMTTSFNGAIPETRRRQLIERVRELQKAVKFAREKANQTEVTDFKPAENLLKFIFD